MRLHYDPENDSLHIYFAEKQCVDSREVHPNVNLDFDETGQLGGIAIWDASQIINWSRLEFESLRPSDQLDDYYGANQQEGAE
jgi:uncharacterized protein YuzE